MNTQERQTMEKADGQPSRLPKPMGIIDIMALPESFGADLDSAASALQEARALVANLRR